MRASPTVSNDHGRAQRRGQALLTLSGIDMAVRFRGVQTHCPKSPTAIGTLKGCLIHMDLNFTRGLYTSNTFCLRECCQRRSGGTAPTAMNTYTHPFLFCLPSVDRFVLPGPAFSHLSQNLLVASICIFQKQSKPGTRSPHVPCNAEF